jgi:hypothetical protein
VTDLQGDNACKNCVKINLTYNEDRIDHNLVTERSVTFSHDHGNVEKDDESAAQQSQIHLNDVSYIVHRKRLVFYQADD